MLEYVPNHFRTQEMCEMAVEENIWLLKYVPDSFKKQKMKAVKKIHTGFAKNTRPKKQK